MSLASRDHMLRLIFLNSKSTKHCLFFRFELVIVWRIQIDEEGKVFPKLDLLTKVPERGRSPCAWIPFPEDFSVYPTKSLHGKNQKLKLSLMYFVDHLLTYFNQ